MNGKNPGAWLAAILLFVLAPFAHAALLAYQVTASPSSIIGNDLILDIPAINAHPAASLIVTPNYTPTAVYNSTYVSTGTSESYLDDPIGVRYDATRRRWFIYDETGAAIPNGASFNILAAPCERVLASALNSQGSVTFFPLARNQPGSLLFVTHLFNPNVTGSTGVLFPRPAGVGYDSTSTGTPIFKHWYVSSQDATPAEAAAWFVFDSSPYKQIRNLTTFTVSPSAQANFASLPVSHNGATVNYDFTPGFAFTNSALDGNPNAVLFVTHLMNDGTYNAATGVYYDGAHWCIVTPSFTGSMGIEFFNVLAFSAPSP